MQKNKPQLKLMVCLGILIFLARALSGTFAMETFNFTKVIFLEILIAHIASGFMSFIFSWVKRGLEIPRSVLPKAFLFSVLGVGSYPFGERSYQKYMLSGT